MIACSLFLGSNEGLSHLPKGVADKIENLKKTRLRWDELASPRF